MHLLNPFMLAFLGLIPVLILLHKLRPKPRQMEVTNLFLWQQVFKERTRNITLRELKKNLPLILQILIIILAVFALASPVWTTFGQNKGDMILVIDTSASMKAGSGSKTRFEQAMEKAHDIVDRRRSDQRVLLIEAGREPRIRTGYVEDTGRAQALLEDLSPSDEPGDLEKSLYFALSFVNPERDDTIYLITDGAGTDLDRLLKIHPGIVPVLVSGGEKNIGITKFDFREEPDRPNHYEMMIEIKNFNPSGVRCPVRLTIDRIPVYEDSLSLEGFEKKLLIIPYHGILSGIAKAVLEVEDDFQTDNSAYLALSASEDIWVLLVSKGNYFLEKLLASYPNVMVNSMKEIVPSSWDEQTRRHDIVIIDRMDFPATKKGNFLIIDSYSPSIPIERTGRTGFPGPLYWNKDDPLMEDIDLDGVVIEEACILKPGKQMKPVIESPETGLLYTYEQNGLRAVFAGFDINRSDLPLRVAFPVLMSNIINWLTPYKLSSSGMAARPGEPLNMYVSPGTSMISILAPGEKWQKHRVSGNPYRYTNTKKVGVYVLAEKNKRRYFTVNLVNESESDIQVPFIKDTLDQPRRRRDVDEVALSKPLWSLFVIVLLVVLLLEWYSWLKFG